MGCGVALLPQFPYPTVLWCNSHQLVPPLLHQFTHPAFQPPTMLTIKHLSSSPLGEATGMAGIDPLLCHICEMEGEGVRKVERGARAEDDDQQEGSTDVMPQRAGAWAKKRPLRQGLECLQRGCADGGGCGAQK